MEITIKRDLLLGTVYVTLKNEGYVGFSITTKYESGKVEKKYFNNPSQAKRYALNAFGAKF